MLSGRGVFSFFLWFRKITIGALRRRSRGDEKSVPQNAARKDRNKNENGKLICSESAVGRDINLLHDILRVRLNHLDELAEEKRVICEKYLNELHNDKIVLPKVREGATHIWHQFVIKSDYRDELMAYLNEKGIGTIIHYPIPPHLSEAYRYLGVKEGSLPITENYAKTVLSIPLYNGMTAEEQDYVIETINAF